MAALHLQHHLYIFLADLVRKKDEAMKHINAMFLPISMGDGRKHTFFFLTLVLAPIWFFKSSRADKNLVLKSFEKQTKKKCSSSCALWGGRHWFDRRVFMRLGRDRNLFWMINPLIFRRALLPPEPRTAPNGSISIKFQIQTLSGQPQVKLGTLLWRARRIYFTINGGAGQYK